LQRISKKIPQEYKEALFTVIDNSYNLLNVFTNYIYPPTYSNSLKEIARFLKFEWTEKDASGLQSTVWRYNWEISKNNNLKCKLLQYNIEDCRALKEVKDWVVSIKGSEDLTQLTSNLKAENIYKWGNTNYIVKDFEEINSRAYFNYQREHIFLRAEKKIYKTIRKQTKNSSIFNKPDKKIDLLPTSCPRCKSKNLIRVRIAKKLQVDLTFMKQGIKKRATLYTGGQSKCLKCKKIFSTVNMRRLPLYGNNLMIWSINQKIQYKQSSELIINLLKDSFKINVSTSEMTCFKEIVAKKYYQTYKEILTQLTQSNLIHIDETIARIKETDGYVWVFANHDSVYYEFRETREADFLKEILKDFKGVLISDF
jgi:DNA-directed RNA polymerase subunit RPC12/RpoP